MPCEHGAEGWRAQGALTRRKLDDEEWSIAERASHHALRSCANPFGQIGLLMPNGLMNSLRSMSPGCFAVSRRTQCEARRVY